MATDSGVKFAPGDIVRCAGDMYLQGKVKAIDSDGTTLLEAWVVNETLVLVRAAPAPDPRDVRIAALERELEARTAEKQAAVEYLKQFTGAFGDEDFDSRTWASDWRDRRRAAHSAAVAAQSPPSADDGQE